jgi:hypothetical protein
VPRTLGRSPHGSGTWRTTGDLRRHHGAHEALTTSCPPQGRERVPARAHLVKISSCAPSSPLRSRASYRRSFTLDKFPVVCRKKPNAKSVSERIWQMSYNMKPNAGNVLHTLISQSSALQEVARLHHGYNAWQMSHHVRPNTLAAR